MVFQERSLPTILSLWVLTHTHLVPSSKGLLTGLNLEATREELWNFWGAEQRARLKDVLPGKRVKSIAV